jgi:S-adenosylmethionine hydrolase
MPTIITLTTDFGLTGHYVAQMKGAILCINPDAQIIDITHAIRPQNIRQGALAMRDATRVFPPGSIHVGVVDPGVGTQRKIIYAEIDGRHYIAPDNGLLSLVAREATAAPCIIALENRKFWRESVSNTFHGRDIMTPVAAHLSLGVEPAELGSELTTMQMLDWPEPVVTAAEATGEVVDIDSFGNAITNIHRTDIPHATPQQWGQIKICVHQRPPIVGLRSTYSEDPPGTLVALFGSGGHLEIACVGGNAAERLSLEIGDRVQMRIE